MTYVMEAKENYDPTRAAEADGSGFPTTTFVDAHLIGWSYDATHREIVYSAIVNRKAGVGSVTNDTGFTLWDGATAIAPGGTYDVNINFNFYLARKAIDTGTVTFYDAYNSANLVPAGIGGGDGTWRRYVSDTAQSDQFPVLSDPRTGDAWVHQESCNLHLFRRSDNYAAVISALRPKGLATDPVIPIGMNADWVYAVEYTSPGLITVRNLYLIPRTITADETTADEILAYATYALPTSPGDAFNEMFFQSAVDNSGDLYFLTWGGASSTAPGWQLWKFTQPSAFVYPTPPVDGGIAEATPWASGTGPNAFANATSWNLTSGRAAMFWSPGRVILNLLTIGTYGGGDAGHVDHTWYDTSDGTWGTNTLADTWMTSGFVPTSVQADVASYISGRMNTTNTYLEKDNFYASGDYASRWVLFEGASIDGSGFPVDSTERFILVNLTWIGKGLPTITAVTDEIDTFDPAYTAYATAIGHSQVVHGSIDNQPLPGFLPCGIDQGLYDSTTNAVWFSGMTSETGLGDNMFKLDPAFTGRVANSAQPPLLRLTGMPTPPVSTRRANGRHRIVRRVA